MRNGILFSSPLTVLVLTAGLFAQTSTTIPVGYDNKDGGQPFSHWSGAGRVMQVLDMSNPRPRPLSQLSWRRRNTTQSNATAGTMQFDLWMAQGDWFQIDSVFENNHKKNTVQVFSGQANMPDWTTPANPGPAPFDFTIKFTKPWVYLGSTPLVWTAVFSNSSAGGRSMDRAFGGYLNQAGTSLGTGCGGHSDYLRIWNTGNYAPISGLHLEVQSTAGPTASPTFVMIDLVDSNLKVPGLCTEVHALPTLILYLGMSDASGDTTRQWFTLPYMAGLQGLDLFTQCLALDTAQPGIPLSLSGGQRAKVPTNTNTSGDPCCYHWITGTSTKLSSSFVFFSGAPVAEGR